MPLPTTLLVVIRYIAIIGAIIVGLTSLGALIRLWSWKTPKNLAIAFLTVVVMFVIFGWVYQRYLAG